MSIPQYLRKASLLIGGPDGNAIDLSDLRFRFSIRRGDIQTPNTADIRVYNVSDQTSDRIRQLLPSPEFTRIIVQGGYDGNFGVLFDGEIKQVRRGRESSTDTYIDITAADGDSAYNYSISAVSLAAGSTPTDQLSEVIKGMAEFSIEKGYIPDMPGNPLPRGKVIYGMTKDELRKIAANTNTAWSIQDGKVQFVPLDSYMPTGQRVAAIDNTEKINAILAENKKLQAEFDAKVKQGDTAREAGDEVGAQAYYKQAKVINEKQGALIAEGRRLKAQERPESLEGVPVITSATGMIGLPEQTQNGIRIKTLLNPNIKIGQAIKIDNKSVQGYRFGLGLSQQASNGMLDQTIKLNADGLYYVMIADHQGDTRGQEWYSDLLCLAIDASIPQNYIPRQGVNGDVGSIKRYG